MGNQRDHAEGFPQAHVISNYASAERKGAFVVFRLVHIVQVTGVQDQMR